MDSSEYQSTRTAKNKNLLFAVVNSAGIGAAACFASALVGESIHSSWQSRCANWPSLRRLCGLVAENKERELGVSWVVLAITAASGAYGFAKAISEKRASKDCTSGRKP